MGRGFELGLLDFGEDAEETVRLGVVAENTGYQRFWIAEHPPQPSALVAITLLLARTSAMRVGTGGVVVGFHAPLQTAMDLRRLEALFPGRIDAGFCGGGAPAPVTAALLGERPVPPFEGALRAHVRHTCELLVPWSTETAAPDVWTMGTSERSALLAAELGTAFAYSLFHQQSVDDTPAVDVYRARFRPSAQRKTPRVALAIAGTCAEAVTEDAAVRATLVGDAAEWRERLAALSSRYRMDDLVHLDLSPRGLARQRSIAAIAEVARGLGA